MCLNHEGENIDAKMVWYLLMITLLAGCAFPGRGGPRLCSDYGDRTTIDIVPLLMRSPDYIDRRLSHLDSETTIDAEHLQTTNYRLLDGSRLKISFRDGLAIGFTIYHRIPFHTPMKSLEVLGFTRWELTNEEIRPTHMNGSMSPKSNGNSNSTRYGILILRAIGWRKRLSWCRTEQTYRTYAANCGWGIPGHEPALDLLEIRSDLPRNILSGVRSIC